MTEQLSPEMTPSHLPMFAVAAGVIAADQLTKWWALSLQPCTDVTPRPFVSFCLARNEGMAFSFGWGAGPMIAVLVMVIVGVTILAARHVSSATRLLLGLVIGGAVGNLIDRAFRSPAPGSTNHGLMSGAVVDFIGSSFFATFNVADAAVVIGAFSVAIVLWRRPSPGPQGTAGET